MGSGLAPSLSSGINNICISPGGGSVTTGDYNLEILSYAGGVTTATADRQIAIGLANSNFLKGILVGSMGARSGEDVSGESLELTGPSAQLNLSSGNMSGGDLIVQGGSASTHASSTGVGGDLILKGGRKGTTGTQGKVFVSDVFNVAAVYTVATLPTGAVGDVARISDGDGSLAWGATAVNSGAGATPYLVWFNASNWTILGS